MTTPGSLGPSDERITRDDIEKSLRAIQTGVEGKVKSKRTRIVQGASLGVVILVLLIYVLGRRSGRKRSTIVVIRRV
jgi:hypothetical protein